MPTLFNKVGAKYRSFTVTKVTPLKELHATLRELIHEPTGAVVMHVENDDPENLFALSLKTIPTDSTGVAHILEHTVLCGSKKYPVKDPFFSMLHRSLHTFMNAFTGADFTCYAAASQVKKDFYNIFEVYLDAVFQPNLKELSFLQEGRRFEFSEKTNPKSPLEIKGIVYNEMKGVLASPESRLSYAMHESMFPDITYGYNSGGDPKVIPSLSYEGLLEFHRKFYHPSRTLFYFYGNLPLVGHLDFILQHTLDRVEKIDPISPLSKQKRLKAPVSKSIPFPTSGGADGGEKGMVGLGWLTCHILEQEELLALSVLDSLLMDTDASPLRKALLKSGYCLQAGSQMDDSMSEIPFTIICRGCAAGAAEELTEVVLSTLRALCEEGISRPIIDGAIHQLELSRSEIADEYGLTLFFRSGLLKQHGGIPEDGLLIHSLFEKLHRNIDKKPKYLEGLIKKFFIDNPHRVVVTMVPDDTLGAREEAEEKEYAAACRAKMTEKEALAIVKRTEELAKFQEEQEDQDLDVLPKVTLHDVPKASRDFLLQQEEVEGIKIHRHEAFTNHLSYVDMVFDLADVKTEDLSLLRLYTHLMPQLGCGGRTYSETLEFMVQNTGGVSVSLSLYPQADNHLKLRPAIALQGRALDRNLPKLMQLLREMVTAMDFTDKERIKEVLMKHHTALVSSLQNKALRYALNHSASGLSASGKISDLWFGLDYYWYIKKLVEGLDKGMDKVIAGLQRIHKQMLGGLKPQLVITCDAEAYKKVRAANFYGVLALPSEKRKLWKGDVPVKPVKTHARDVASAVAFSAKVMETIGYTHEDAAALAVAVNLFDNKTLHPRIREQGGAYGGHASYSGSSATLSFYAYRDPHIVATIDAFDEAVADLIAGKFTAQDLEEAKLEVVQELDSPVAPGSRGDVAYSWLRGGKTHARRQHFRDNMLALTKKQVIAAVEKHIAPKMKGAPTVVFAGKELVTKENALFKERGTKELELQPV